ncbi:MAG: hypothetical protein ACBR12_27190 [Microcoleus sp.]
MNVNVNRPEGQFFQGSSSGSVYLIQNGQRHQILNPQVDLVAMGINWNRVWQVPDQDLNGIPLGDSDGNYSIQTAKYLAPSPADFGDGIDHKAAEGSIGGNLDREDYYRFTLDKISDVDIQLSGNNSSAKFYLAKDLNGNGKLDYGEALQGVSNGNIKNISHSLGAGTYYVVVSSDDTVNQTKYSLKVDTKPETAGNSPSAAQDIGVLNGNKTFTGLVDTKEDTYDYYRFNLNETSNVSLKLDKLIAESSSQTQGINPIVTVELMSANNEILASARGDSSSAASINRLLEPGFYYVRVNSTETSGYVSYELNLGGEPDYKKPNEPPSLDKTVGYDGTNTNQTYVNTFNRNGGSSALGSPTGNVHPSGTENGYVQEFSGGSEGSGAIMKSGANDNSYWVGNFFWNAYVQTGAVTGVLGYPTSDRYEFNGGWKQDFQGGALSTTLPLTPTPNSGENTSPTYPSPTPQANNPSGFTPVLFTRSSGVDTNYGIKLRTDTRLNAPSEGVTYAAQFEFDGWKHGEAVQDKTLPNGKMDAMWYRIKGTNHWIPSAFINGYPPGVTNSVGSNGGDNASGNVGTEFTTPLNSNVTEANPLRGFIHPLGNPKIQQSQGNNTGSHVDRAAYSIDFPANIGTPVLAMRQGKVVAVRDIYPDTGGILKLISSVKNWG